MKPRFMEGLVRTAPPVVIDKNTTPGFLTKRTIAEVHCAGPDAVFARWLHVLPCFSSKICIISILMDKHKKGQITTLLKHNGSQTALRMN